jgi:hypothetical protein
MTSCAAPEPDADVVEAVVDDDGFREVFEEDGVIAFEEDAAVVVDADDVVVVPSLFWCTTN